MQRPELWVCRHGETAWSRDRKHTGLTDLALTEVGVEEARQLGTWLAGMDFGLVLTSPRRRARDTAALAGFADAQTEPDAAEWDYGDYEGMTTATIRESAPGWTVWRDGVPGGESPAQVAARADRVIDRVLTDGAGRALLFAHGHFLRVLAARWLELPGHQGGRFLLGTARGGVLGWEREQRALARWNIAATGSGASVRSP